jgi:hypothetical protein
MFALFVAVVFTTGVTVLVTAADPVWLIVCDTGPTPVAVAVIVELNVGVTTPEPVGDTRLAPVTVLLTMPVPVAVFDAFSIVAAVAVLEIVD